MDPLAPFAGVLRSSSSERWANCPASAALEALFPEDETSPEAMEGHAAHELAAAALEWGVDAVREHGDLSASNGVPFTEDMYDGAGLYAGVVAEETRGLAPTAKHHVELLLDNDAVHRQNQGTPDYGAICGVTKRVVIVDYKYGFGSVPANGNTQTINYAALLLAAHGFGPDDLADWRVTLAVVQPRDFTPAGRVKRVEHTGDGFAYLWRNLRDAACEATGVNPEYRTGEWCRYCDGLQACPAALTAAAYAGDMAARGAPHALEGEVLGRVLKHLQNAQTRLDNLVKALEAEGVNRVRAGQAVPGFAMGWADTKDKWVVPTDNVVALGKMLGADFAKAGSVTPGQAKTALKKLGIDAAVIASYHDKPRGAAKLISVNTAASAAQAFGERAPVIPSVSTEQDQ